MEFKYILSHKRPFRRFMHSLCKNENILMCGKAHCQFVVCCWFSSLLREVFLRVLRFSPLLKNQYFQIPIDSEKPREGRATVGRVQFGSPRNFLNPVISKFDKHVVLLPINYRASENFFFVVQKFV